MIVKFDHITYVANRSDKAEVLPKDREATFVEAGLRNMDIKQELMKNRQADHDLYYYDDVIPVEYIFYNETAEEGGIERRDNCFYAHYSDFDRAVSFLTGIFGKKVSISGEEIHCNMKGILDKQDIMLILVKGENKVETYLDKKGYGVATLINNGKFNKVPEDGYCTEHEQITVHNRELDICFTGSDSVDIIFEIIAVLSDKAGEKKQ